MSERTKPAAQRFISLSDAADYLSVTERTVRNLIARGELPAYRIGKRVIRLKSADVDALLKPIPATGTFGDAA